MLRAEQLPEPTAESMPSTVRRALRTAYDNL